MPTTHHLIRVGLPSYMSDRELLSNLLNIPEEKAQERLDAVPLTHLASMTFDELRYAAPFTERQATTLIAAAAYGRRITRHIETSTIISCPEDVVNLMAPELDDLHQEELHVLLLSVRNRVVSKRMIYRGNINCSVARPAEMIRPAILAALPSIVLVHNHPSGDPTPSGADVAITKDTAEAASLMGIDLLDHIVMAPDRRWVSMKEAKLFQTPSNYRSAAQDQNVH